MDYVNKFSQIVESGDVSIRLKPRYNLQSPEDRIKFNRFIHETVERFQTQKFVTNRNGKLYGKLINHFSVSKRSTDEVIPCLYFRQQCNR